jgi:DNA-3-methyladenine glycosylase
MFMLGVLLFLSQNTIMATEKILPQSFYKKSTVAVARALLGKIIIRKKNGKVYRARITEVEAYLGINDRACHTFGGRRTFRVRSMYLDGGNAYVYFIYGMYFCLNAVTRTKEHPEAVLIRAAEPLSGWSNPSPKLLSGPGRLCRELKITHRQDGHALFKKTEKLVIADDGLKIKKSHIDVGPRIGVAYAGPAQHWPLRFYLKGQKSVSGRTSK